MAAVSRGGGRRLWSRDLGPAEVGRGRWGRGELGPGRRGVRTPCVSLQHWVTIQGLRLVQSTFGGSGEARSKNSFGLHQLGATGSWQAASFV